MKPVIIVIGPAQHGKSTFRRALASALNAKGASCSDYLYSLWAYLDGTRSAEELRKVEKEAARPLLIALGDWITTHAVSFSTHFPVHVLPYVDPSKLDKTPLPRPHPGALIQMACAEGVEVLDGVRRRCELDAAKPYFAWFLRPLRVVWVQDPRKDGPKDNLDLTCDDAERIFINDGSVAELEAKARRFAEEILEES